MSKRQSTDSSASETQALSMLKGLHGWLAEKAGGVDAEAAERHIMKQMLAIGREAMITYFAKKGTGDVGTHVTDTDEVTYRRHAQRQEKTYISIFGELTIQRTGYHRVGHSMQFPLDAEANLPKRRISYPLQNLANDFSMNGRFQDALKRLEPWRGQGVWDHSAHCIVQESAVDYAAFYRDKPAPDPAPPEEYLLVGLDGKGVPMVKKEAAKIQAKLGSGEKRQKKKEALVGICCTVGPKIRRAEDVAENLVYPERARERRRASGETNDDDPKPRDIRRLASLKPKIEVVAELVQEAERRDPTHERALTILVDGADSLRGLADNAFTAWPADRRFVILDIIKVREYLWKAAHAFHAEGSDEASAFVYKYLADILRGRVGYVIGGLKSSKSKRALRGAKANAVNDVVRYDVYLSYGFPISTSRVESTCKALVKDRMEGSGMRWSIDGAESMLRLRSLLLSGDWKDYWAYHIDSEKHRRYGKLLPALHPAPGKPRLRPTG